MFGTLWCFMTPKVISGHQSIGRYTVLVHYVFGRWIWPCICASNGLNILTPTDTDHQIIKYINELGLSPGFEFGNKNFTNSYQKITDINSNSSDHLIYNLELHHGRWGYGLVKITSWLTKCGDKICQLGLINFEFLW